MAKKGKAIKVRLVPESGVGSFYTTHKSPKMAEKLEKRKFNKATRQYELYKEKKIK